MSILLLGQHSLVFELADLLDLEGSDYVQLTETSQLPSIDCDGEIIVYADLLHVVERGKPEAADFQKLKQVCEFARENNARLVCLSSSEVFSPATSKTYAESSEIDGDTSLSLAFVEYENTVKRLVKKHFLLRTSGVFTTGPGNYFSVLLEQAGKNEVLEVPSLGKCSFTASIDLARVILAVIQQLNCGVEDWGVYHYCCSDQTAFSDFADAVVSTASQFIDIKANKVVEVAGEGFSTFGHVTSPKISCQKLRNVFGIQQRPWRMFLADYLREMTQ